MGEQEEPFYGEPSEQEPHMGEADEPKGSRNKPMSTGTTASEETGADMDDAEKAGMRPSGSGGSARPPQNR
jgi:hypothetical protein